MMRGRRSQVDRTNARTRKWLMDTDHVILPGSLTLHTLNNPSMCVAIGSQRTHQGAHGLKPQVMTHDNRLPNQYLLRLSKPVVPPQIGLSFCPLPLPLHMRRVIPPWHLPHRCRLRQHRRLHMRRVIPLWHLSHLCRRPLHRRMWHRGSGRIVKPFMLRLQVRRVRV